MTTIPSAQSQAAQAERAYAALVAHEPQRRPDAAAEAAIRAWAEEALGSARFIPWLRLWTAVQGRFREGWLPDSYLARHVLPGLQGGAGRRLGASRMLARRILGTDLMPDRAYRVRGFWLDRAGRAIAPETVEKVAFGRAATLLLRRDSAPRGQILTRIDRECFARETSAAVGDLTLIAPPAPDPALADLAPGGLPLMRLVTVKPEGEAARLAGSLLRLPTDGAALPRPGQEIALPLAEGLVSGAGLGPDWLPLARHPESRAPFEGRALAGHAAAEAACRALHDKLPHLTLIGWDVLPAADGKIKLIDWDPGVTETGALQALSGPVFASLGWEDLWRDQAPARAPEATPKPALTLVPDPEPVTDPPPAPAPDPAEPVLQAPQPIRPRRVTLPRALRRRA